MKPMCVKTPAMEAMSDSYMSTHRSRVAATSLTPDSIKESKGAKVAYLPVELEHASTYGVNTPSNESLALAPLHAQQLLGHQVYSPSFGKIMFWQSAERYGLVWKLM